MCHSSNTIEIIPCLLAKLVLLVGNFFQGDNSETLFPFSGAYAILNSDLCGNLY